VGLPVYIACAVWAVNQFERPSILLELGIYVGLGIVWILPFKFVFMGIGQADPDQDK
jgi:hypothetical protein